LQDTETRWDKNSSQADSAGSIPVTRSMLEYCCSRTAFGNSRSLPSLSFGPRAGHFGPHSSTPRDSLFRFRGRSACSVVFSGLFGSPVFQCHPGVSPQVGARRERAQLQHRAGTRPVITCTRRRVRHKGARPVDHTPVRTPERPPGREWCPSLGVTFRQGASVTYDLQNRLVIGLASSALFDLTESDEVFRS
jgi:hypothetical protein